MCMYTYFDFNASYFTQFWYETLERDAIDYSSTLLDMISHSRYRQLDEEYYLGDDSKKSDSCGSSSLLGSDVLHLSSDLSRCNNPVFKRVQQVCAKEISIQTHFLKPNLAFWNYLKC